MQAMTANLLRMAFPLVGLLASAGASWAAAPLDPSGVWLVEDTRARIRVEKCGTRQDRICGYVVWLQQTTGDDGKPLTDINNPDPKRRSRASVGHQLMIGLSPNEDSRHEGKIYNAENGKSYDISIWLDGPNTLNVRGCLVAFLCQTQKWTRVKDAAPGQLVGATGTPTGPRPDPEFAAAYTEVNGTDTGKKATTAAAARP